MHVWETKRDKLEQNIAELLTHEPRHTRIDIHSGAVSKVVYWTDLLTGKRHVLMRTRLETEMMRVLLRITRARNPQVINQPALKIVGGKSLRRKAR